MTKAFASSLFVLLALSGCSSLPDLGAATTRPASTQAATQATQSTSGEWTGTLTYKWSESDSQSGGGVTSESSQTYEAHVQIGSVSVDIDRWDLNGNAKIDATRSILFEQSISGGGISCTEHHQDDATANGQDAIEGGMEIADDFYQFNVELPVINGSETSVREYSAGCGTNETDVHDWPTSPLTVGGSGDLTDPNSISGTDTDSTGATTTWNLTRTP